MKVTVTAAALLTLAMGAVIFFCRAFPFLFFSGNKNPASGGKKIFLEFAERIAPPAAMTVLTFYSLAPYLKTFAAWVKTAFLSLPAPSGMSAALAGIAAAVLTAAVHIWKRNALLSIFGGTAVYMILQRLIHA
ncbi:MAG: AzlD domain-containing protein [Treponema sp.]|nr:AzlD domain-containing protein [Treponema sp.]